MVAGTHVPFQVALVMEMGLFSSRIVINISIKCLKMWIPLFPLLARDEECKAARELLQSHEVRLVTITGPGGVGKTHLAMVVAQSLEEVFTDGICWVPLSMISNPEQVFPDIARVLGMKETAPDLLWAALCAFLQDKHMLMLIDNCEQVLAVAPKFAELLERCPRLSMLITSRAALRVRGEHVLPLFPLPLPALTRITDLSSLSDNPAVALFVARARGLEPRFHLTEANASAVAEICRRLDGLPLAIELAAAHILLLSPRQMVARLSQRLDLLKGGRRDLPSRHYTLRDCIQWSYDLLSPEEQRLFRRLCLFTGSCSLAAITFVCQLLGEDWFTIERGVGILLDHHVLQSGEHIEYDRYFIILETIREFGLKELAASGEIEVVQRAHAEYAAHLATTAPEEQLFVQDQAEVTGMALWLDEPTEQNILFSMPETGIETYRPTSTRSRYPVGLTEREVQVLRLLVQGLTNKQIASQLVLSPRTINVHVTSIYNKIGVNSRSAATRFACDYNLA